MIVTLVVPRYIGVREFGFWQLYLLYGSMGQLAQLGWADGVVVRYAGRDIEDIDPRAFSRQLFLQAVLVSGVAGVFVVAGLFQQSDVRFIILALAVNIILTNTRFMMLRLFQATRSMRWYANNTIVDRVVYVLLVFGLMALGGQYYELLILGSLVARGVALAVALWQGREVLSLPEGVGRSDFAEAVKNISSGFRTVMAVLAGTLSIALVRLVIEWFWDLETFANVSLGLNVASLVSVFVSGLSFAILPFLRRLDIEAARELFLPMRALVSIVLVASLVMYFPVKLVLPLWLPQYDLAFEVLHLLVPLAVFDGRSSLLTVTYLRAARMESRVFAVSVCVLLMNVVGGVAAASVGMLDVVLLTLLAGAVVRSVLLERGLKAQGIVVGPVAGVEVLGVALFVLLTEFVGGVGALVLFTVVVLGYAFLMRSDLRIGVGRILRSLRKPRRS